MAKFSDKFPTGMEPNFTWGGPTPDIGDLRVHMTRYRDGSVRSVSCWELQLAELLEVIRTGKVYLSVYGNHPPVYVGTALEFGHPDEPTEVAKQLEQAREAEVWFHPEINEFVNDLLENAPGEYDDDAAASAIAVKYVRDLEAERDLLRARIFAAVEAGDAGNTDTDELLEMLWPTDEEGDEMQADRDTEEELIDDDRR
jgi:hypothetical protein